VSLQDSGTYRCSAKYRSIQYNSQQAYIEVVEDHTTQIDFYNSFTTKQQNNKQPPKFLLYPEDRNVVEDDEVIFECLAYNDASFSQDTNINFSEHQYYKYKWLKDGVALDLRSSNTNDQNNRFKLVQGVNLKIEKLKDTDAGTYTCRICNWNRDINSIKYNIEMDNDQSGLYDYKNLDSSDLNTFERDECDERSSVLKVLVSPRFLKRPFNLNVTLKSDAELECSAYGIPTPTIQWFKNGEPIYPSEYFQFNPNQGNLKILGIITQDEGYYQCLASNELNTIQSIAQLTVLTDDYGDNLNNQYDYDNLDESSKKSSKSSKNKKTNSQTTKVNKQSTTTTIVPTTSSIVVHLSAPRDFKIIKTKSRSFNIEWQQPSIIRNELNKPNLNTLSYSISWKPKNMDRQREMNTTLNSILIDDLLPDTVYIIQVCAMIGTTKGPATSIEVKTDVEALVPGAPIDFKAEFVLESDDKMSSVQILKLKWRKPTVNANNIAFYRLYYQHLHYGPINNQDETSSSSLNEEASFDNNSEYQDDESLLLNENSTEQNQEKYIDIDLSTENIDHDYEYLLDELMKYSTYKFRLVAIDNSTSDKNIESNDLQYSAEILVETPSDVPDGAPENIQIETLNTTSIMVQWDLPALEKRNGLIVGYKIAVKENDKQLWNSNVDSEPRRKIIAGLQAGHKYSVRVTAKTINGSGPSSEWLIAETFSHEMDETKQPGQPIDLIADPTDKTIVLHWTPPNDSNRTLIRKYLLRYGIGFPDNEIELPGNRNSFIINDLIPSSQYVVSLKAINNAGFGMEVLKDVVTKRKSALADNENLFPPLNVQAVAISSQSIEVRWTDWHLKPDESIPDDRYYSIRYNIAADQSIKYKFKNATERNIIISDLKPNTLYDFSVRLVIGRRESEWSMTTSQMTMEQSPAPRDITIKSDPNTPNTVILTWSPPKFPQNTDTSIIPTGYIIYYLDENTFKLNSNHKWRMEHLQTSNPSIKLQHSIRKLKLETVYYFKIQSRNNRAYGASSPLIIFKTPNSKGEGGGKIFMPNEFQSKNGAGTDYNYNSDPSVVLNSITSQRSRSYTEMNIIWIIIASISSLFILVFILFAIFMCKRSTRNKVKSKSSKNNTLSPKSLGGTLNRQTSSRNRSGKFAAALGDEQFDNIMNPSSHPSQEDDDETESTYIKTSANHHIQQQQHLIMQSNHLSCSNSTSSTLLKQQQHYQRTPSHLNHPLVINNPNHLMMNHMMNPISISNSANTTSNNDVEFYSNMTATQQMFSNNSEHYNNNNNIINESANSNNNYNRTSSFNEDNFSQTGDLINNVDMINTSAAIAAANAAFNAPIFSNNLNSNTMNNSNEPSFLRHTIRPKPIAIPLGNTNVTNMTSNSAMNQAQHDSQMFNLASTNTTRKSFKNLRKLI
jgi:hypothetical protein